MFFSSPSDIPLGLSFNPETNRLHLKIHGWKMVSFSEGTTLQVLLLIFQEIRQPPGMYQICGTYHKLLTQQYQTNLNWCRISSKLYGSFREGNGQPVDIK